MQIKTGPCCTDQDLTPVALSAAIEDALEPYGVRVTSLPISAEQIVEWASSR